IAGILLFFGRSLLRRAPHSFPTRRSSDLIFLARLMPLEGGLYQWTSIALGRFAGFMLAWNLWAYAVLIGATFGVTIATNAAYLLDRKSTRLNSSHVASSYAVFCLKKKTY